MAEKILNSRIVNKHDTEAHWLLAAGFTPKQGELIVYDIDANHSYERFKIGDGVQNVNDLPFVIDVLTVTITCDDNGVCSSDVTYDEIIEAINTNKVVQLVDNNNNVAPLSWLDNDSIGFTASYGYDGTGVSGIDRSHIGSYEWTIQSNGEWTRQVYEVSNVDKADIESIADEQITLHNESDVAHSDIRTEIRNINTLVGDTAVSEQINVAVESKADINHTHDAIFLKSASASLPASENWSSVVYGSDKFVAVAKGSDQAAYSTDGITWTLTPLPSYAQWCAVAYGYGRFMTVAYGSNKAAYSLDGITWQESTLPTSGDWCGIAYADGPGFVTVGQLSDVCVYGVTGAGWSTSTLPVVEYWTDITSDGDTIVAIAQAPNAIISTMDAYTWDRHSTAIYSGGLMATAYGGDKFVAISSGDGEACYTGANGRWYATTIGVNNWRDVVYGGDKFVAIAGNTNIASYSTDGITWLETTMPVSADWRGISYGNGVFTAVAYDSDVCAFSYDGIVWHQEIKALQDKNGNDVVTQIESLLAGKVGQDELDEVSMLIGDVPVVEQINDALLNSQSDMLQNDSTKANYVKNRTHWKEELGVQALFDGTIETDSGWNLVQYSPISLEIKAGAVYSVVYDGATYEVVGKIGSDNLPYIGSNSLWHNNDYVETEEPFCYGDGWFGASVDGTHTVVISGEATRWHTISEEYLPGVLIHTGDGYKSEIFNDLSNEATGNYSHAEGLYTVAAGLCQHVQGRYNIIDEGSKYLHIVGNGNSEANRSNVHTLDWHGKAWFAGDIRVGGTSYEQGTSILPLSTIVTLKADSWTGDSNPWSQRVTINGVGLFSKVDLQPTATQIVDLQNEDIMLMIENNMRTTTAYAIGNKPTKDYTMQVLITGVIPV